MLENGNILNTFNKGMNKDLAKTNIANGQYSEALNIRLITNEGETSGAVVNIKGNSLSFIIPDTKKLFTLDITPFSTSSYNYSLYIANTSTSQSFVFTGNGGISELINNIITTVNNTINLAIAVKSTNTSIVFYHNTLNIINITLTDLASSTITNGIEIVDEQSNLQILGYTTIRNDIYVFTTANSNTTTEGAGQIWKLTYNPITLNPNNPELKYNNLVNFSLSYPIQAIGRYENTNIQRLYWTDNNNKVRSLNVAGNDSMGVPVKLLDLKPGVNMKRPVLTEILSGGNLNSGVYYYFYRLKRDGIVTKFSLPSNPVSIVTASEQTGSNWDYFEVNNEITGNVIKTSTDKAVKVIIDDIDSSYEYIEFAVAYKENANDFPLVYGLQESKIDPSGTIEFIHTGTELTTTLSVDLLTSFGTAFDFAKTIVSKDNRLIAGNVRTQNYNTLQFNARAYRFKRYSTDSYVTLNLTATDWGIDPFDKNTSQDALNAINPYNQEFDGNIANVYAYKLNSNELGGSGPNVEYKFIKVPISGDNRHNPGNNPTDTSAEFSVPITNPVRGTEMLNDSSGIIKYATNLDGEYENVNAYKNFKSPYIQSTLKGYTRGEVYRFGLVLFDKTGKQSFVNWIGDIKFPELSQEHSGEGTNEVPIGSTFYDWAAHTGITNDTRLYSLGIQFDIDLTSVINDISGYAIVRVKREYKDKTILGSGITHPLASGYFVQDSSDIEGIGWMEFGTGSPSTSVASISNTNYWWWGLTGPDLQLGDELNSSDIEFIKVEAWVLNHYKANIRLQGGSNPWHKAVKLFSTTKTLDHSVMGGYFYDIPKAIYVKEALLLNDGKDGFINGYHMFNYTVKNSSSENASVGTKSLFFVIDDSKSSAINYHTIVNNNSDYDAHKILLQYGRKVLNQYGGDTEEARAKNIYQLCSYVPIDGTSNTSKVDVFAGDTFVSLYGVTHFMDNGYGVHTLVDDATTGQAFGIVFPCESTVNPEFRDGHHFLNKKDPDYRDYYASQGDIYGDTYEYNKVFSEENDIVNFIPYPYNYEFIEEFDTRIYASNPKVNGETIDAWRMFSNLIYLDLEGLYGTLNNLIVFKNNIYSLQNNAFGIVRVNPKTLIQTDSGDSLDLGKGKVLHDYIYYSTKYGSAHQWGNLATENGIYFFDSGVKKMFLFNQSLSELSMIKGMSSYFDVNITKNIINSDNPLLYKGMTSVYDKRFDEILFTFRDYTTDKIDGFSGESVNYNAIKLLYNETTHDAVTSVDDVPNDYTNGNCISVIVFNHTTNETFETTVNNITEGNSDIIMMFNDDIPNVSEGDIIYVTCKYNLSFTLAYNELIQAYTSFYSFTPSIYINDNKNIFTPNNLQENNLYIHNKGNYGEFYETVYDSSIKALINHYPQNIKTFDNLALYTEVSKNNIDINKSFTKIRIYNKYQNTDYQTPVISGIYKTLRRVEREWQYKVPRDLVIDPSIDIFDSSNLDTTRKYSPRIRDRFIYADIVFDNSNNEKFVLHYIKTSSRISFK